MNQTGRLTAVSVAPRSIENVGDRPPRLMCIGAHPDDCEDKAGGLAALWTARGGVCRLLAVTDGSSGHQQQAGAALARRRADEAAAAAAVLGADSVILDNQDGCLMPTLENRHKVIRAIREFAPDVIATHRVNDYHPDHRYTSVLVQDSCYLVMVPNVVPTTPPPAREPIVIFMYDRFTRPSGLRPDLVFDIDSVIDKKLDSFTCHRSQVEEWMPWMGGYEDDIPEEPAARREYLRRTCYASVESKEVAERFRDTLVANYGDNQGRQVQYAEAFEVSEYAAALDDERAKWFFPF
jgi:LmbE family N-acetylglucosaminyl deacetylase